MYFHKKFMYNQLLLILILTFALSLFSQNGRQVAAAVVEKKGAILPRATMEKIMQEFKALPKVRLTRNQAKAGLKLQANTVKALTVLSKNENEVPLRVRNAAKTVLKSIKAGQLATPFNNAIPNLVSNFPGQHHPNNNPAGQLETVLQTIRPTSPLGIRSPLDGVISFLVSNVATVNHLLFRTLGPAPDLLDGVIHTLLDGLDAVSEALVGSLNSLGPALGGALGGGGGPLGNVLG